MAEKIGILGLGLIGRLAAELIIPHGYDCYAIRRKARKIFQKWEETWLKALEN